MKIYNGRRYKRVSNEVRFWSKVKRSTGCWEWSGCLSSTGYGQFHKRVGDVTRRMGAHRFSWELAHDRRVPNGMDICHRCDNRKCVRPDHLFLGTRADNMRDASQKGRVHKPRWIEHRHPRAVLSDGQVIAARALYGAGVAVRKIVKLLPASQSVVESAVYGRTFKHLPM